MIQMIYVYLRNAIIGAVPIFCFWLLLRVFYCFVVRRLRRRRFPKKLEQSSRKKDLIRREVILSVFAAYLIVLVEITVIRFYGVIELFGRISKPQTRVIQIVPFLKTFEELEIGVSAFLYPVLGNIGWFLPFGFLAAYLFPKLSKCIKVTLAGAALSFSIEVLQWIFGTGISDIDDIIFNASGAAMGYGCYCIFSKWKKRLKNDLSAI